MTTETKAKRRNIDADGHYVEPPFAIPEYIEPKYRDAAPRIVQEDDGKEYWRGRGWWDDNTQMGPQTGSGGQRQNATAVPGLAGIARWNQGADIGNVQNLNYTQMNPSANDPAARLKVMDEEEIDVCVLFPTLNLQWIDDAEYHMAVNRALNDWLAAEYLGADRKRLYGAVNIVGVHDVGLACAEVERCVKEHGFKVVFLRPCHANPDARWWSDYYDPLWATCQDLDVAVGFHPFPGDTMYGSARYFDMIGPEAAQVFGRTPVNHPVDAMQLLTGLICGAKLEQFPKLRFAILESGGGWLITLLERLDGRYEHLGHTIPDVKMEPSDYFRRQGWISFDPEEAVLPLTSEWIGADRIIWGSDFPHPDAFYPKFIEMLNGKIGSLTPENQARIRGLNALDFYKIPAL